MRVLLAMSALLLLAGCGGSDSDGGPGPAPTPAPIVYKPISNEALGRIGPRMSEAQVRRIVRVDPVLEQRPTKQFPGGCLFYRIANLPLANVQLICSNEEGVQVLTPGYSPNQPKPPEGSSQRRAALLARADSTCQSQYGDLGKITKDVAAALSAYGQAANAANTRAVGEVIARFVGNIEETEELLSAYVPPPDAEDVLTAYLETLRSQTELLKDARAAFLAGEMAEYDRLGTEFTELGKEGKRLAREYGFSQCSASTFG